MIRRSCKHIKPPSGGFMFLNTALNRQCKFVENNNDDSDASRAPELSTTWRRGRDSNPRSPFEAQQLSRLLLSTTQPPLQAIPKKLQLCYTEDTMSNENLQTQNGAPMNARVEPLLQWRVYKYAPLDSLPWLRIAGVDGFLVLIAAILLFQRSYFGVTTFVAAAVVIALFLTRKPPVFSAAILPDSIVFQKDRYAFGDLDGFAINFGRLIIFQKGDKGTVHIPIDPQDSDEIQNFLVAHLQHRDYDPTLLDVLEELLRI